MLDFFFFFHHKQLELSTRHWQSRYVKTSVLGLILSAVIWRPDFHLLFCDSPLIVRSCRRLKGCHNILSSVLDVYLKSDLISSSWLYMKMNEYF